MFFKCFKFRRKTQETYEYAGVTHDFFRSPVFFHKSVNRMSQRRFRPVLLFQGLLEDFHMHVAKTLDFLGGQSFIPEVLDKVERAREIIDSQGFGADIQIDGGITPETGRLARAAGADIFVAGTAIFGRPDPVEAVAALRAALED